jgi:hypothetical protein
MLYLGGKFKNEEYRKEELGKGVVDFTYLSSIPDSLESQRLRLEICIKKAGPNQ